MLFKIGNKVHTPQVEPCAIIFKNDEERLHVIDILQSMPIKEGDRALIACPSGWTSEERIEWSILTEAEKKLL